MLYNNGDDCCKFFFFRFVCSLTRQALRSSFVLSKSKPPSGEISNFITITPFVYRVCFACLPAFEARKSFLLSLFVLLLPSSNEGTAFLYTLEAKAAQAMLSSVVFSVVFFLEMQTKEERLQQLFRENNRNWGNWGGDSTEATTGSWEEFIVIKRTAGRRAKRRLEG